MKINTHGGHNRIVEGASKYLNEVTEDRAVNAHFTDCMRKLGHTVYDCTDNKGKTQSENLRNIVANHNKHKVDYGFSFHLNSFNGVARGVEVHIYDKRNEELAAKISKSISDKLGIPNRGVKISPYLYVVQNTKELMFLVECCFVDSKEDYEVWDAKACAEAVVEAVTGEKPVKDKLYPKVYLSSENGKLFEVVSVSEKGEVKTKEKR